MRRVLAVAVLLLVAAAAGYAVYWQSAARTLERGIADWAEQQRRAGYEISYRAPEIGGFPLHLEARIEAPEIAAPPGELAWRWRGPALYLHARPWAPLDFETEAPGRHEIELDEGGGGAPHVYLIDAETAKGSGSFGIDGRLAQALVALTGVTAAEAGRESEPIRIASATVRISPGRAEEHTEPSLAFLLALGGLTLPPSAESPLGRDVGKLEIEGAVMGALPEFEDEAELRDALARWRDDGGTLELDRVVADWGALELTGDGTFALDGALQPIGAMSAMIVGHDAVIDALVANGAVDPRDGSLAKVVLSVLSKPSPVDGRPELTVPLSLQDGHLWIGPAKLAPLPHIEWP